MKTGSVNSIEEKWKDWGGGFRRECVGEHCIAAGSGRFDSLMGLLSCGRYIWTLGCSAWSEKEVFRKFLPEGVWGWAWGWGEQEPHPALCSMEVF